ncbi:MAG: DUF3649 domain-containing protein [Ottowia sp.]|uniref:DUF3649 domain-containing protein n=1 Tax=Ottowia sp. TaxID=1898956 RepID=UPI0039E358FF
MPDLASTQAAAAPAVFAKALGAAPLVSRIVAAVFGGYALAALTSVAALVLPMARPQAVIAGMLASFVVYTCAVIWVFAARSARRAWAGLLVAAAPLALAAWPVWNGGASA